VVDRERIVLDRQLPSIGTQGVLADLRAATLAQYLVLMLFLLARKHKRCTRVLALVKSLSVVPSS